MKRAIISLATIWFSMGTAFASADTDYPHRDWGRVAILDMTPAEATSCVAQGISRSFERVLPIPVEKGTDIDAGPGGGFFGVSHDPWVRLKIRQEEGGVTLHAFYRHPLSQERIGKEIARMQKRCLKVRSIQPKEIPTG